MQERHDDPAKVRGRTNETTAADVLAWIPRVLFAPVSFVTEYGIREPVQAVSDWVSRNHVVEFLDEVVFHPTPNITWYPAFAVDVGVVTAAGATVTLDDLGARGHTVKVTSVLGAPSFWRVAAHDVWRAGRFQLSLDGFTTSRSNVAFYGLGPYSSSVETYFTQTRFEGFACAAFEVPHVRVAASEGFRSDQTGPGDAPSIETVYPTESLPGFGATNLAMARLDLRLDSRHDPDAPGGARLLANVTYGRDVKVASRSFVSGRVDAQAAVEVSRPDRVLTLRGYLADSAPLGAEPVPFLEQPTLGGDVHYGFLWGRFRDESAVMVELGYRYPVAFFVDMLWIASVGNVFTRDFSDFDVKALTASFSVGLRTRRTGQIPFQLLLGVGTTRFDQEMGIDSVRLYLSTTEDL